MYTRSAVALFAVLALPVPTMPGPPPPITLEQICTAVGGCVPLPPAPEPTPAPEPEPDERDDRPPPRENTCPDVVYVPELPPPPCKGKGN